jgi:hypothetical protein
MVGMRLVHGSWASLLPWPSVPVRAFRRDSAARSVRLRLLDQRISKVVHGVGDILRVADSQGTVEHPGGAFGQLRNLYLFCRPR